MKNFLEGMLTSLDIGTLTQMRRVTTNKYTNLLL